MSCHSQMIGAEFSREDIAATARRCGLLSLEIDLSLACNFRCRYCYVNPNGAGVPELSPDEIRDVILQAGELGARKIILLGGEPMIYPHVLDILAFIRGRGLTAEVFTNGTNITADTARRLRELDVHVALKMNSRDEAIQDDLAGTPGAYRIIQAAFRNLRAAGYPSAKAVLAVSTVICAQNLPELVPLWTWLRDQAIVPYFEIITPQGNAVENRALEVDLPALHRLFQELAEIDRTRYGYAWDPQPPLVGDRCMRHQFSCLVTATGSVLPCVGVTIPVGNIRERRLRDILRDSEVIQDLRAYTETIHGPCAACDKAAECYGCRGAAYQLTGDYLASDPLCWRNAGREARIMRLPAPVAPLIPHQGPMQVVDRLLSVGERTAVVETVVRRECPFVDDDGTLAPAAYVELIAQSAAVMNGFRTVERKRHAPAGYLLGVRNLEIGGAARVGDTLHVHVFKAARFGEFGMIEGRVRNGETVLARGEIKVWHATGNPAPGATP